MIKEIEKDIYKIKGFCNVYLLMLDEIIVIDTSAHENKETIRKGIEKITPLSSVSKVILTHFHYDHIGNIDLFPNAEFFAHKDEIKAYKSNPRGTIANRDYIKENNIRIKELGEKIGPLKVLHTPGHTIGSVCLYFESKKIMFSGDTIFGRGIIGRTDLPTSDREKMKETLKMLSKYEISALCPGHG